MEKPASGEIADNIGAVRKRIEAACGRVGRSPDEVTLIAVTKMQSADRIAQAYQAGIRDFGENYVQEALGKIGQPPLDWPDARWHFIGHLQSNKARFIVGLADAGSNLMVQSVDSAGIAREIARRAVEQGISVPILLEVKLDPAPEKYGFAPDRVLEEAAAIRQMRGLNICGLMGMAPFNDDPEQARPHFKQLQRLYAQLPETERRVLSMGMTADFEVAVEEGATHLRIGTALFGSRPART